MALLSMTKNLPFDQAAINGEQQPKQPRHSVRRRRWKFANSSTKASAKFQARAPADSSRAAGVTPATTRAANAVRATIQHQTAGREEETKAKARKEQERTTARGKHHGGEKPFDNWIMLA